VSPYAVVGYMLAKSPDPLAQSPNPDDDAIISRDKQAFLA